MPDMSLVKHPMPQRDPIERSRDFGEVALGYSLETAQAEARRCLDCKNPACVKGCPVGVRIPEFIKKLSDGDIEGAYSTIKLDNSLPAICGRVCPQESQCESKCVRGIKGEPVAIGRLERFCADASAGKAVNVEKPESRNMRVAVIGSGPAGLSCAGALNALGYDVTVFEALHTPGGVLVYGIPEFRLPKALVKQEIETLEKAGVKIETNVVVGKSITLKELLEEEGFAAAFVSTGAGLPKFQGIKGEELCCVYSANEFLTRVNLMKAYKFPEKLTPVKVGSSCAVVGGGNVAMDAARVAKRLGCEHVRIIYRRSEAEMPARREEVEHAKEEGIEFLMLCNPVEFTGDENGFVKSVKCVRMELGEPDASGRRRPVEVAGSEFEVEISSAVIAIGNAPNPLIPQTTEGLETSKWGGIAVKENTLQTSVEGVYAGGDIVTGAATVILAMGAGKKAAAEIDEYLKNK